MRKNVTSEQMLYTAASRERYPSGGSLSQVGITEQTFYKSKRRVAGMGDRGSDADARTIRVHRGA